MTLDVVGSLKRMMEADDWYLHLSQEDANAVRGYFYVMDEQLRTLRPFASAGVLAGARLAQHEGLVPDVFAVPPEDDFEAWMKTLTALLLPLGEAGYLILYALTHLVEGAPNLLLYLTTAEINRSVAGAAPDVRDGIIEYKGPGAEDGGHYPGVSEDLSPLRALLNVAERWSIADRCDRCEE